MAYIQDGEIWVHAGEGARRVSTPLDGHKYLRVKWIPGQDRLVGVLTPGNDLIVMSSDGEQQAVVPLADDEGMQVFDFDVSPDGDLVVYSLGGPQEGARELAISDLQGRVIQALEALWNDRPVWSPDGSQIAFYWAGEAVGDEGIYILDVGEPRPYMVFEIAQWKLGGIAWAPDGQSLTFLSNDDAGTISLLSLDTRTARSIYEMQETPFVFDVEWAPGAEHLVFRGTDDMGQYWDDRLGAIYSLNTRTGVIEALTDREVEAWSSSCRR
jgi:Tol biopolymer transport system component